jgi:hypothetical protein
MRLQSLLALTALLLPLAATAENGKFPPGKEAAFMAQCKQVAIGKGLSEAKATDHCQCGAAVIKKKFSSEQIEDLDSNDGVDANLMKEAQAAVHQACPTTP